MRRQTLVMVDEKKSFPPKILRTRETEGKQNQTEEIKLHAEYRKRVIERSLDTDTQTDEKGGGKKIEMKQQSGIITQEKAT